MKKSLTLHFLAFVMFGFLGPFSVITFFPKYFKNLKRSILQGNKMVFKMFFFFYDKLKQ